MRFTALAALVLLACFLLPANLAVPSTPPATPALRVPAMSAPHVVAASPPVPLPAAFGGIWTLLGTHAPGRDSPVWVYDSRADRFILFGGASSGLQVLNDTWAYDYTNNTWTNLTHVVAPSPRAAAVMVYDAKADRTILFGGEDASLNPLGDTWIFDYLNETWTNVTKPYAPSARGGAMMAYDPTVDKTLLVGGFPFYSQTVDTWAFDYTTETWTYLIPTGSPPECFYASMVYDSTARVSLLFGGETIAGSIAVAINETYTYNATANAWVQLFPIGSPPARAAGGMAYDADAQQAILFGGTDGPAASNVRSDTWAFNSTRHTWANLTPAASPAARLDLGMAYDARADRVVLFGGTFATDVTSDEAWSYEFGAALPYAPRNLAATAGASKVTLTWAPPLSDGGSAVTGYGLYRGTASGGETFLTTLGTALTYTDTAVTAGTTYFYEIAAVTAVGTGPRSSETSAAPTIPDTTPPVIAITAPANHTVLTSVDLTVIGTASDNVGLAQVEVSTDGATWLLATGTTIWMANLTLPAGADTIYARARDTSGNNATTQISVTVQLAAPGSELLGGGILIWILLAVLFVVAVVAAVLVVMRLGRRPPPVEGVPPRSPPQPPAGPPGSP